MNGGGASMWRRSGIHRAALDRALGERQRRVLAMPAATGLSGRNLRPQRCKPLIAKPEDDVFREAIRIASKRGQIYIHRDRALTPPP
jgi:hypothetical protein